MEKHINPDLNSVINHRCAKYLAEEEKRKEGTERLNKSIDMNKVAQWRKIEDHQHRPDQDDIDLGFV